MERYSGKIGGKMHLSRLNALFILALLALGSCLAQSYAPARAQGIFMTPTPLPAISATATAAALRSDAANANLQQAAQLEAQAAELRRNGEAQQAQAQQAINDARAAGIAQNSAAFGEAIGRAIGSMEEMSKTNTAQASLIDSLRAKVEVQAAEIISATNELQQERSAHQIAAAASSAMQQQLIEAQKQNESTPISTLVFAAGFLAMLAILIVVVLQRKSKTDAALRVNVVTSADDVIDGDEQGEAE